MKSLRTLDESLLTQLGYNNQSSSVSININNITDIDSIAFKGYTQLTSLSIQQSSLSKIDLGLFKDSVNLQSLNFLYNPILTQLTNSKKIIFSFVQILVFKDCPLSNLDSNVVNAFPNLTTFDFKSSSANLVQLSPLKVNQLSPWKKLKILSISTKNQTSLTKEHFNGLSSLTFLSFMKSNIKTVEVHTLLALPNVTAVDLSYNDITAFEYLQIPDKLIRLNLEGNKMNYFMLSRTMGYLKYLYINNNLFRSFKSMDFTFLANLTILDLSNNPHAYPNEIAGHMKPLVNLIDVRLNNLSISSIDSNFFKQNLNLYRIDLNKNKISVLPYNTFSHLISLTSLGLNYNQINVLDNRTFVGLNLQYISLANNNLTKIAPRTFYNLNMLYILDASSNSISEVDSSAFIGCYNLRYLYLDINRLSKISPGTFENLTLHTLSLSNNQLTELNNSTFAGLRSLVYLEIYANKISRIGPRTFYGLNIATLRFDWNLLTELDNDTFVGQNELSYVDFSFNMFFSFKQGTFNNLINLKYIYLDGNYAIQLDNSTFVGCNNLREISVLYRYTNLPKDNLKSLCPVDAVNCKVIY